MPPAPERPARRHAARAVIAGAVSLALFAGCSAGGAASNDSSATTAAGSGTLFDDAIVHDMDIVFDEAAYDGMIQTFLSTGDKTWIEATITIDGATFQKVGLRLKGNSSLRGLTRSGSADTPQDLPWLVRLDKHVDGQEYKSYTEFVVRSNNSRTALNEAVALELLELAGLAAQDSVSTRLSVNGSQDVLRLVVENPGDRWDEDTFTTDGILYKAESSGDYSYRGDDPASYEEVFDQETNEDNENLTPLIEFLEFVNTSDDATFATGLGKHLDVEAFATYLAMEELIANRDDIDGPGNNSYLRYDTGSGVFTVVPWDHNLAFGSMGAGRAGGANNGGGQNQAGAQQAPAGGGAGMPGGRKNVLVERFLADESFKARYAQALTDLKAELYASGKAAQILQDREAVLIAQAGDLVDAETVRQEAAKIETYLG